MSANFVGYLIGYVVAIVGVYFLLDAAGLDQKWTIAVIFILAGLGIVYALRHAEGDRARRGATRPVQYREQSVERVSGDVPPPPAPGATRSTTTTRSYE